MSKFNEICESVLNEANKSLTSDPTFKDLMKFIKQLKSLSVDERKQKLKELGISPTSKDGQILLDFADFESKVIKPK